MIFGYARVSTAEQKIETQIELLKQQDCEKIYTDIASGVREDRKGLNEMLSFLREGDVVIVYKTDRIFRSLKNMIELIEFFNQKGVFFKSISEPAFDTTSANGKFIIQIFGAVAEFERNLISERTKAGIEGARRRKKLIGRPKGIKKKLWKNITSPFISMKTKIFLSIKPVNKRASAKPASTEWKRP